MRTHAPLSILNFFFAVGPLPQPPVFSLYRRMWCVVDQASGVREQGRACCMLRELTNLSSVGNRKQVSPEGRCPDQMFK